MKNDLSIPIAIVLSGVLIAGAIIFTDKSHATPVAAIQGNTADQQAPVAQKVPDSVLAIKSDDHVIGNPNANVIIIEYSDPQCPFCQRFHETMASIMATYSGENGVAWVYRHFPLDSIHPYARKGAEALECASAQGGNAAFSKFEDEIFSPSTTSIAPDALPGLAKTAGLDVAKFTSCLSSGIYAARVDRDYKEGASIGVQGTPYSVAWNKQTKMQQAINGAQSFATVSAVVESLGAIRSK